MMDGTHRVMGRWKCGKFPSRGFHAARQQQMPSTLMVRSIAKRCVSNHAARVRISSSGTPRYDSSIRENVVDVTASIENPDDLGHVAFRTIKDDERP